MAFYKLYSAFRQVTLSRQNNVIGRYLSSYLSGKQSSVLPPYVSNNPMCITYPAMHITFKPRTLNIDFANPDGVKNKNIIETPFKNIPSMEEPLTQYPNQHDIPLVDKSFELPPSENVWEKLAVRLIVIRRHKMKKHKRRKLRKRMKYLWAKIRLRRNLRREKEFQAELINKIKVAEAFDPKAYVNERLSILQREFIPRTYKGEILPQYEIKQFLDKEKAQKERRANKVWLKLD
ncbi:uncharacterized protein LOC128878418 [Hylaeus volcanicus]|uniref:uncharacterized protein LOC128878418 n=1 Tax=Hylaeus volcanicus TaxID=313075 RepID=UPI0023B7D103|nr:uncharacterized protein LOC128878418 [Hylaeus volcanicus]